MKKLICLLITLLISTSALALTADLQKVFKDKDACFILYDVKTNKIVTEFNQQRCAQKFFACSTFKIAIALMAFDQGILQAENTIIKWDGIKRGFPEWDHDQTPRSWLKYSSVWVSKWIMPQIGMAKVKKYLADFSYGNQDMSGGITSAWLSSSLKISAYEQINFLKNLWLENLPVSKFAITMTKNNLPKEVFASGDILYGKTGSGFLDGRENPKSRMLGWFVGYIIHNNHPYIFATNYSDLKPNTNKSFAAKALSPGETTKAATMQILRELRFL